MYIRRDTTILLFVLDLSFAVFCVSNVFTLMDRPAVPFAVSTEGRRTVVSGLVDPPSCGDVLPGDTLESIGLSAVLRQEHVEFIADREIIGRTLSLSVLRDGERIESNITLIPFYPSFRFPIVMALTGIIVFGFGMMQLFRPHDDPAGRALHWALLFLAAVTLLTQGPLRSDSIPGILRRGMFLMSYSMLPAWFLLFCLTFPTMRLRSYARTRNLLIGGFGLVGVVVALLMIYAVRDVAPTGFGLFQSVYDVFRLLFLVTVLTGLLFLTTGYVKETLPERRSALKWMFLGLIVAAIPFPVLIVFPELAANTLLIDEELAVMCTLAVPLTFTVAFLRTRVFRLPAERFRTAAITMLHIMTGLTHILVATVVVSIVWGEQIFSEHIVAAVALVAALVILNPLRVRLHQTLDEFLFPARSSPARILRKTSHRFSGELSAVSLGGALVDEIRSLVPRADVFWYRSRGNVLRLGETGGAFAPLTLQLPDAVASEWKSGGFILLPKAARGMTEETGSGARDWVRLLGFSGVFPMVSTTGGILGAVALRLHANGGPLTPEEVDVIRTLCDQAAAVLTRLSLQESIILEHEGRRRMEELSHLKTHFVSSVSHDLRTPLTSISMFTEMLRHQPVSKRRRNEYLKHIAGEVQRLSRIVEQVLDFSRIERGAREFDKGPVSVRRIVEHAVASMRPQFASSGGSLTASLPRRVPDILGDSAALESALINVLSNALAYSGKRKRASVRVSQSDTTLSIVVRDNGVGIDAAALPHLFDPFYRVRDPKVAHVGGLGLGLAIVRDTIEAHGGRVTVESEVGKGTAVVFSIPVRERRPEETNP